MKKSVLLFASLLLAAVSAIAQPAKPEVTYTDWASVEEKADIYLYNVEAGMFLSAGSSWGTRATLVGTQDKKTYNDLITGSGKFEGRVWYIVASESRMGENCFKFMNFGNIDESNGQGKKGYLAADNPDGVWVDGGDGRPNDGWYIAKDNGNKTFQLGYIKKVAQKDEAGNEVKVGEETVYDYNKMGLLGAQKFAEGNLETFIDESNEAYTTWALVTVDEYKRVEPLFKVYYIAEGLKKTLNDAKALGIADFPEYEEMLTKEGVTYDQYKAAIDQLTPAVTFGQVILEAKEMDANHSWTKFETIFADTKSTNADFTANTAILKAYMSLKKNLDDAAKYSIDTAEQAALYNNNDASAEELEKASTAVYEMVKEYELAHATLDNPGEITHKLTNVDGTSATDWTRTWLGDGRVGDFHLNTWSVEGNNNADGTNMVVNFLEDWVGRGSTLSDQKFQRNPVKVAPGAYKITANIRVYNESGADYMKGAYLFGNVSRNSLFANEDEAQTNAVEGAKYNTYNNMLNYWKDGFEAYTIVPEDGTLTFGMMIENANYNWVAAKNFRVYYMGDSYESLDYVRNNSDMFAQPFPEETLAMQQLLDDYNNAIPNYGKAKNAEELLDVVQKLVSLSDSVQNNANAYKAYKDRVDGLKTGIENGEIDLDGPDADILFDYLDDIGEELGPDSETSVEYGFKNGYSAYIIANRLLKTEEITEELEFLNKLYDAAVRTSLKDGTDLTNLIVNPGFEEADGKGWSLDTSKGGTGSLTNWHGGNANNYCAEAFQQNFDIYQEIEGVKDGLYEVSVQAFYRTAANQAAYEAYVNDPEMKGDAKVYPEVYINEFSSKIRNVMEIQFKDKELDEANTNTYHPDGTEVYTLDGMTSASNAFSLTDPTRNFTMSAYGIVQDGKLRLGLRKLDGPTNAAQWTLWDNFKLTYRAKNPEVAAKVLASKSQELADLIENSSDAMTDPILQLAQDAYKESIKTDLNNTAKYDVLIETNEALVAAQENIKLIDAYKAAEQAYDDACTALETVDPNAAIFAEVKEMDEEIAGDAYMDLNNEELDDLTVRVKALTDKVNAAKADAEMKKVKEEMASASDDAPYDATGFIVNPDMSIGKADGWTVMALGQNNGYQDNNTYTNGDVSLNQFIECWRSGAILSDGTIEQTTAATLPAGTYTLGADINAKWQPDATVAIEGLVLFVSDAEGKTNSTLLDTQDASPKHFDVTFKLDKESVITLGVMAKSTNANWLAADNFKLTYYGTASAKEESGDAGDANAIEGVEEAAPAAKAIVAIYNAAGAQISTLQPGINIVKYADGTTKKIFKK